MDPSDPAYRGQKDYGPFLLSIYDWWVLRFMANRVWHSPIPPYLESYATLIGRRHLDVGPGSGYFLDHGAPDGTDITLLDPNSDVLDHCTTRLARFAPSAVEADVLKPLPVEGPYDSAAMSFVMHCLPGPLENKARAVRNVAAVLSDDGVLFGGTLLGFEADHTWAARSVLKVGNRQGGFDNGTDTADGLEKILRESFEHVTVTTENSIAVFEARRPKRTSYRTPTEGDE